MGAARGARACGAESPFLCRERRGAPRWKNATPEGFKPWNDGPKAVNSAVALAVTVLLMLLGTGVAVFTGMVDPLPASKLAAQEFQLRELAMSVFVVGAAFVAWRTTMHGIR